MWLGHNRGSSEVLIGTPDGVVRARAVKRKPEEERWRADAILNITGTPARPNPQMPGHDIPVHIHVQFDVDHCLPGEPAPARVEIVSRRTYLKACDFQKHGWTEGCEGCRRLKTGRIKVMSLKRLPRIFLKLGIVNKHGKACINQRHQYRAPVLAKGPDQLLLSSTPQGLCNRGNVSRTFKRRQCNEI